MALPDDIRSRVFPLTGIDLEVQLASILHSTRVERATDGTGTGAVAIALLPPGQAFLRDLRDNNTTWWYRCRHEGLEDTDSNWTPWVCQIAIPLDVVFDRPDVLTVPAAARIFEAGTISVVDAAGAASSLSYTLRIPATQFHVGNDTDDFTFGIDGVVSPRTTTGATITFNGSIPVPKGVTVTGFRARLRRATVSDLAQAILKDYDDTTTTAHVTLQHSTTGWATLEDTTLSVLVADEMWFATVDLRANAAAADANFAWIEIDYTRPTLTTVY